MNKNKEKRPPILTGAWCRKRSVLSHLVRLCEGTSFFALRGAESSCVTPLMKSTGEPKNSF